MYSSNQQLELERETKNSWRRIPVTWVNFSKILIKSKQNNLVQVSLEFELSKCKLWRFYCSIKQISSDQQASSGISFIHLYCFYLLQYKLPLVM